MEIGGIDITIPAKQTLSGPDLVKIILQKMSKFWPEAAFQNADSENIYLHSDPYVAAVGIESKEFFLHETWAIAEEWDAQPELKNKMFHFLIDDHYSDEHYVTMVVDEEDDFVNQLVKEFRELFI